MNGGLSRQKDKTVSKEEIGAMTEHSVQPGELVATKEYQNLCHKLRNIDCTFRYTTKIQPTARNIKSRLLSA
jgi:hypothetical protein